MLTAYRTTYNTSLIICICRQTPPFLSFEKTYVSFGVRVPFPTVVSHATCIVLFAIVDSQSVTSDDSHSLDGTHLALFLQ